MAENKKFIVDLFSGCGGFSLGAHLAGFETALAIDVDERLSSSFERNFPTSTLRNWDLSSVEEPAFREVLGGKKVSGIIGGPPCQGFSLMGKRNVKDPRNELVGHFFRHVRNLSPNFFVMENVPGILIGDARDTLMAGLDTVSSKYKIVGPVEIDAADFGAATRRKRVIVVGYDEQYVDPISEDALTASGGHEKATVKDAILDLPSPRTVDVDDDGFDWLAYSTKGETQALSEYARVMREMPGEGLGWELAKVAMLKGKISGFVPTQHSDAVVRRFLETPQGETERISRYPRLKWNAQCTTLRAGTGPDRGSFQSVRPIHPEEPRVITVREAARLQGFPDWFVFHPAKWHSFRMIGNSVSPFVSKHLLKIIAGKVGVEPLAREAA